MTWPQWVQDVARSAGRTRAKPRSSWAQLVHILNARQTSLVLDVGANRGQYARRLRKEGYLGTMRSFEPLPDLHALLSEQAQGDPLWEIAEPLVIGRQNGMVRFSRSREDDMSSVLAQTDLQERLSPSSAVLETLELPEKRLDALFGGFAMPTHLKLDVQGYEDAVLDGLGALMSELSSIQLEMSLVPIYQGERPWLEMIERLRDAGFALHLIIPGYFEHKLARQLQIDGVFVNTCSGR